MDVDTYGYKEDEKGNIVVIALHIQVGGHTLDPRVACQTSFQ